MDFKIIQEYVAVANNYKKRLLLNVGGQVITGEYLDINNNDFSNSNDINEKALDRISSQVDKSSKENVIHLKNVQIYFNKEDNIQLDMLSIDTFNISAITIN